MAAKNDIRICDKCKHTNIKTMLPKVEALSDDSRIRVGCKSYCGPCSRFAFIFINGRYITAPTEDEAIEKAKRHVKK